MGEGAARDLQAALEAAVAGRREADHRAKNTLQLIHSLIRLQARHAKEDAVRQGLRELLQRVTAVSVVERWVERSERGDLVDVAALIRELVTELVASAGRNDVRIGLELETFAVDARQAAPLALLVSESASNALQHAFPDGRGGRITIRCGRTAGALELTVTDNGAGASVRAAQFGMSLIRLMTQQLRGDLQLTPSADGLSISVRAPCDLA